ncbi:hypothetical protein [Burkholderia sp. Bp9140]|uniref:hypothetical protein n=1 Tax=Burkholderia sp. Bp9140 TaxID=2184572 RepID=UPI000F58A226|nr:hypothetical protein [Burkholderia sp. Bp9140]
MTARSIGIDGGRPAVGFGLLPDHTAIGPRRIERDASRSVQPAPADVPDRSANGIASSRADGQAGCRLPDRLAEWLLATAGRLRPIGSGPRAAHCAEIARDAVSMNPPF